jgi:5,6-dimethylbenzimidazole synthase
VSIFDPDRLGRPLGTPDDAEPVAILCLGPVPDFPDRAALEIVSENGWPTSPTPAVGLPTCP